MTEFLNEEIEKIKRKNDLFKLKNSPESIRSESKYSDKKGIEIVRNHKRSQSKFNNELIQKLYSSNNFEKNIKVLNDNTNTNNPNKCKGDFNLVIILENTNAELRKELLYYRQNISNIYENIKLSIEKNKLKINIKQLNDDIKTLSEIEFFISELVLKIIVKLNFI